MEAFPVGAASSKAGQPSACLDYDFTVLTSAERTLELILAPTLAFQPGHGLRYTVQIDAQPARTVDAWEHFTDEAWRKVVGDGVHRVDTPLGKVSAGPHALHVCRVDAGVVLERVLILSAPSHEYLGPPESARVAAAKE
jgi:hypothetical protein